MKRKEMVERLKHFFVSEDWCDEADDDFATEIIDFLVSQGMQPPPIQVQEYLVPAQDGQDALIPYTTTLNQWEPEETP